MIDRDLETIREGAAGDKTILEALGNYSDEQIHKVAEEYREAFGQPDGNEPSSSSGGANPQNRELVTTHFEPPGISLEAQTPKQVKQPNRPSEQEVQEHEKTHLPFRDWCEHCVRGRAETIRIVERTNQTGKSTQ